MTHILTASGRKRALSLRLAVSAMICLAVAPAVARQCPRGEFYRVSKGICVPKADARKRLGGPHGWARAHGGVGIPQGMEVIHSEASTAYAPDKHPASEAEDAVALKLKQPVSASPANVSHSPYGELTIETFAKPQ